MSRPIKMTDQIFKEIMVAFATKMKDFRMLDGKIEYNTQYEYPEDKTRASLVFSADAWKKMMMILLDFDSEVAWHGVVERDPEDDSFFKVTDILVYPQVASSATVDSDKTEYQKWLIGQGMKLNQIRLQGHSHVTMSTGPSGTDTSNWKEFLSQVGEDDFYIFTIYNKKLERTIKIFDLKNNVMYDNKEIDVAVDDDELIDFIEEARDMVKKKTWSNSKWGSGYSYPAKKSGYNYNYYADSDYDYYGGTYGVYSGYGKKWETEWEDDDGVIEVK